MERVSFKNITALPIVIAADAKYVVDPGQSATFFGEGLRIARKMAAAGKMRIDEIPAMPNRVVAVASQVQAEPATHVVEEPPVVEETISKGRKKRDQKPPEEIL